MIIPDTNLLLFAVNEHYEQHDSARAWWKEVLTNREVGLPLVVQFGFLRIGSNERIYHPPASVFLLMERLELWLALPNVRSIQPGPRHYALMSNLLEDRKNSYPGSRLTDFHLAALAMEHRATLCSNDQGFADYTGLSWNDPLK
ncbi:MAG: type II toxin-antitoxin system VapC family toxin [Verrucomicrobia bacterium]|nr:MAG: type II toxin-antitoxin system VapC family toxin [Verrucomicrobiota bacterium]